jgi:hypothetical protein
MEITVILVVEAKDEFSGGDGRLPTAQEAASLVNDQLADSTRGDFELPWMVRSVRIA